MHQFLSSIGFSGILKKEDLELIKFLPGFYYIGEIRPQEEGIKLKTTGGKIHPLKAQGWKHF